MLNTEQSSDLEVPSLTANDKSVMWKFGIALGLVVIPILWLRRSTPGPKRGVLPKARVVEDGSAPGSGDQPPRAGPAVASQAGARNPAKLSRTIKKLSWAVTVSLVVMLWSIAVFHAARPSSVKPLPHWLSAVSPRAALLGEEEPLQGKQRAWIHVSLQNTYPLTKKGGGFAIELRNLGKTPALQASLIDYVVIEELDRLTGGEEAGSHPSTAVGTLAPGGGFATDVWFNTSAEAVIGLSQGKVRAVNYAIVTYEDTFHRTHTTRSCSYWHGGLSAPLPCEGFNSFE
jgi:hypothetical protein